MVKSKKNRVFAFLIDGKFLVEVLKLKALDLLGDRRK